MDTPTHLTHQLTVVVNHCETLIEQDEKERAVTPLVFVMDHPATDYTTRDRAEDLFLDLEAELCPRVIYDGRERAKELLQSMVTTDLEHLLLN